MVPIMVKVTNVMETMVWQVMESILDQRPDMCRCENCRADMAAYALNRLSPHYAATKKGEVLIKTASLDGGMNVALMVALTEAMEIVKANPHHEKE